ncbi:MAG: NolG efflux transporter [Bdellovibrionales bacterium RIFCSPHIGHO2_01_FULL_40_29]|nr:MAG: NolG efflux transporter [Bdellovibrionales bacterium RIFCSPHIGHO2_01_FULL_40_29]OFZ34189.1 MAG: NolG efflux transporter [Bdellovibrionales bacterium RIFCSPHIGHO2_02_FULL_40_15]
MNLAELSIKRPIFITCLVILMIVLGYTSYKKMPVDQFPDVTFPVVFIEIIYPGASPIDIERQVTKVIEDQLSSLPGLEDLSSNNFDSAAFVVVKFRLGTDIKEAEQQVRNRVSNVRNKLPMDVQEPVIRRFDPADQPIISLAVSSEMDAGDLYDVVDETIKPYFERVQDVGLVRIIGGRKKEIQVLVDKNKLQDRQISMLQVAKKIEDSSKDIPLGKIENQSDETLLRTVGEFSNLDQLKNVSVNFVGSDRPVLLSEIATITRGLETATRFSSIDGKTSLFLEVYKQSGSNTVAVADRVKERLSTVNDLLKEKKINADIMMVRDGSIPIRLNVLDVKESITFGILLCIIVVFFFLGSVKSTFITGLALPNSLLGGFILMYAMGYSINIMTLLALSLAVGLLIDDAIVVRENIFRHLEMGKSPRQAALDGTKEVTLAVVATTLVVIAVFGPISFVPGIVGQFFKQFGMTVVFTMIISLFDALTVAPMLSAYMAKNTDHIKGQGPIGRMLTSFDRFQTRLEDFYEAALKWTVGHRKTVLVSAFAFFVATLFLGAFVPKTFLPPNDIGEFGVTVELPTGTSLAGTLEFSKKVEDIIRGTKGVNLVSMTVGSNSAEANKSSFFVGLVPAKDRDQTTTEVKAVVREALASFSDQAVIAVSEIDISGGGQKPLNLYLVGDDLNVLSEFTLKLQERVKKIPGLVDVDTNFRAGKPEFHVVFDRLRSEVLGVSTSQAGMELRYRTEGYTPAIFRENGIEYDIRVRFPDNSKDLRKEFATTFVPNQNMNMVPLSRVAVSEEKQGFSQINRQNKARYIALTANLGPDGNLGSASSEIERVLKTEMKPPVGVTYKFEGQAKDFQDLLVNMLVALGLGVLFIYLVLSSLYESFITPFAILLALPLAISGAFLGLFIFNKSIDIFSIIGFILLMGVVAKNSILLVDYANQMLKSGLSMNESLIRAGRTRLRPILMTSLALIAGTLPIAIGITELGTQRQSMGVAIIGGVLSSTFLTLLVVPAAYGYIDQFRLWLHKLIVKVQGDSAIDQAEETAPQAEAIHS